jgi:hypothetical protein
MISENIHNDVSPSRREKKILGSFSRKAVSFMRMGLIKKALFWLSWYPGGK